MLWMDFQFFLKKIVNYSLPKAVESFSTSNIIFSSSFVSRLLEKPDCLK